VDGYFVFSRDLTEMKRSEALNAAIAASALDCIIVADEAGRIVEFNPAAERTFGHARSAAIGRPIGDLIGSEALRARLEAGVPRFLQTGQEPLLGRRIEVEAVRADGSRFPAELAIAEVRLADRRLFTGYLRDLTASRAAAAEIGRQREALMQAEKLAALGSLLAGVAHELNNPLSIVLAGTLMLQEDLEAAGLAEPAGRAERVRTAAERCARIVRSFLAMARQQAVQRRPVAVGPLVDSVLELLTYGLRSDGIEVVRDTPPGLPPLLGDADQLHQVLANLLTNARQVLAGQAGARRIRITARCQGDLVELAVADNGPGIPPAIRGRIFEPFFTTKSAGSGTGIGLAVSRGLVEALGGTLELAEAAEEGRGARFVLRLPRALEDPAPVPPPEREAAAPAAPATGGAARAALIVDDEAEVAAVLAEILGGLGYRCDHAATGREARRLLSADDGQAGYDVILCDLRMPDMGGAALYAWLEKHRPALCGRIAFVTGDTLGRGAGAFLARSGRPVLEKPFVPQEVRRLVASLAPPP
jgi:two-component system NtrC family sensor kinase